MTKRYRAVVVGLGPRGTIHLHGLLQNAEKFEVAGICELDAQRLAAAGEAYGIDPEKRFLDAWDMLQALRPDVMAFVTMPQIRLSLVEMAARAGVRGLMLEKPMASSLAEAAAIRGVCEEAGIKAAVCHQHKYLRAFDQLREALQREALGKVERIHVSCRPQASQLGTHYIDYMLWANGGVRAQSVVGHAHGSFYLDDSHPSPDYILGQAAFANGVRGILECGYFSPRHAAYETSFTHGAGEAAYWTDDRLTVYGTKGYAWAECGGRYACFTADTAPEVRAGDYGDFFEHEQFLAQVRYTADFARWLDGEDGFSCDVDTAYHGYEILEAVYRSALDYGRIDLPLLPDSAQDTEHRLRTVLHPVPYRDV